MNATAKAFAISAVACGMHIGVPAAPAPENTPDCYVEWVQAKGDLYIDTGIIGRVGTKSEIYFGNIKSTWADVMLGSFIVDNGDEKRIHLCGFFYEEVYLQYGSKYKEGAAKYGSVPVGGDYLTETEFAADGTLTGRTVNANGTSETATVNWAEELGLIDTRTTMYLFADHRCEPASGIDKAEGFHKGRLYYAKIWQTERFGCHVLQARARL